MVFSLPPSGLLVNPPALEGSFLKVFLEMFYQVYIWKSILIL
jgi:hypothetical protein